MQPTQMENTTDAGKSPINCHIFMEIIQTDKDINTSVADKDDYHIFSLFLLSFSIICEFVV